MSRLRKNVYDVLIIVFSLCIALALLFSLVIMGGSVNLAQADDLTNIEQQLSDINSSSVRSTKVGYSAEYIGTVTRTIPTVSDEGLYRYPVYGTTLENSTEEERQAIINENAYLCASSTTYDSMDADGNLYLNGVKLNRKLYKHTAAEGMYYGNLSDVEPAIIKKLHIEPRDAGDNITGLYAPAGEVITIQMSEEDFEKTGGLVVYIGQVLQNGQANNISADKALNRMPVIVNAMTTMSSTAYVGSFLGGPIYVKPVNAGVEFTVTISGGVMYSHYISGYTTAEEFALNAASTAPYFDFEVWDDCVRLSGPDIGATSFDYDDLCGTAQMWTNIASVSNQIPQSGVSSIGITFLFDCFVESGSACAFVGKNTVNAPVSWMDEALDADSFISLGAWGVIHEYNHNYQLYGMSGGSEVCNNAITLISYTLFTDISASRTLNGGLSGWNVYTAPNLALQTTLAANESGAKDTALDAYANILHSFGQDAFIKAAVACGGVTNSDDTWFKALCDVTHYDMTYYFTQLLNVSISDEVLKSVAQANYPMYVPVASVYQTGAIYNYDGEKVTVKTVQPFEISRDEDYTFNLNEQIVIPDGFEYSIVDVSQPESGSIQKLSDRVYKYTFGEDSRSGDFTVKIKVTRTDGAFEEDDVELVFGFASKADMLVRTVYTYDSKVYSTPQSAFLYNYEGYSTKVVEDNFNSTQNSNTDVWMTNDQRATAATNNTIVEVSGKVYIASDGKYRFAIRGRQYVALFLSVDGGITYISAANLQNTGSTDFFPEDVSSYYDMTLKKGQYVYFKEVMLAYHNNSFVGMGWGKIDSNGNVTIDYAKNAIRVTEEYEQFEMNDAYPKTYEYTYAHDCNVSQTLISSQYTPWDTMGATAIQNLFDDDDTNYILNSSYDISEDNPFKVTVELGKAITANTFTIYGEPTKKYQPKNFVLYGGMELSAMNVLASVTDAELDGDNIVVRFDDATIKYYSLIVTDTYATTQRYRYICYRRAEFSYSGTTVDLLAPNDSSISYYGDWAKVSGAYTFGYNYRSRGGYFTLDFEGVQFELFLNQGAYFYVEIDGQVIQSLDFANDGSNLAYMSPLLSFGKHTVKVVSQSTMCVDAIGIAQTNCNHATFNPDVGKGVGVINATVVTNANNGSWQATDSADGSGEYIVDNDEVLNYNNVLSGLDEGTVSCSIDYPQADEPSMANTIMDNGEELLTPDNANLPNTYMPHADMVIKDAPSILDKISKQTWIIIGCIAGGVLIAMAVCIGIIIYKRNH